MAPVDGKAGGSLEPRQRKSSSCKLRRANGGAKPASSRPGTGTSPKDQPPPPAPPLPATLAGASTARVSVALEGLQHIESLEGPSFAPLALTGPPLKALRVVPSVGGQRSTRPPPCHV
ncbi:hypothetical protein CCMA1212_006157 [Trichoderma ghanense]|uniref:Uncharacterized protein n=1 Tax=Trichoderma ghanense TaxID=65468 RepID=A0ABY2H1M8_9HYPO